MTLVSIALEFGLYFKIYEFIRFGTSCHSPKVQFNLNFSWILKALALTLLP